MCRRPRGFSLLELIVAVAIVAVLVAIAVPLFARSTPQDRLREAATDLVSNIRIARSMVIGGQTHGVVGSVDAVEVTFDEASDAYTITALNLGTVPPTAGIVKTVSLSSYTGATLELTAAITPSPATPIRFAKNGSADRIATITITESNIAMSRQIEITRAGLSRTQ